MTAQAERAETAAFSEAHPFHEPGPGSGSSNVLGRHGKRRRVPAREQLWRQPLPFLSHEPLTRLLCRFGTALGRRWILDIEGLENVDPSLDPFLFACNHSQRPEALFLPSTLIFHRRGRLLHFLADWPTLLVPVAGLMLHRNRPILVGAKSARLTFLNRLRPWLVPPEPAFDRALDRLQQGSSVGVFPEGRMNRDPRHLLRGQSGAARLALHAQVPVVPAGTVFPNLGLGQRIGDRDRLVLRIGTPIQPPTLRASRPSSDEIRSFHARIFAEIARLSGKTWSPRARRR